MPQKKERASKKKKDIAKAEEQQAGFQMSRINEFATEVKGEFGKIAWPAKKQTMASTAVVAALVMLISFYLGAVDLVLGKLIGYVLR